MLDIKRIRQNPDELILAMQRRGGSNANVATLMALDGERRGLIVEAEELKAQRNAVSAQIPKLQKEGQDTAPLKLEMRGVSERIKALDERLASLEQQLEPLLLSLPNYPAPDLPDGDETNNKEVARWGEPPRFDFVPQPHWDLGERLNILDFALAGKITGSRFALYRGLGARLERALVNFFLDVHTARGYTEIFPPFLVNRASMTGTGQLPKFEEDSFKIEGTDYFLVPTAEVPLTNLFRDQILTMEDLPQRLCAYTACFRSEAGAAGRDTRGLIRVHQFNKVELVALTPPEDSYAMLERLTRDAARLLEQLGLAHRIVMLAAGDIGFGAAKTYDIEVWLPSYERYVEISSCTNFLDFQARRAKIRFKREKGGKAELVHTLNGSGLAVGRTVAAILENFQQADGSVKVPEVLVPYMGTDVIRP